MAMMIPRPFSCSGPCLHFPQPLACLQILCEAIMNCLQLVETTKAYHSPRRLPMLPIHQEPAPRLISPLLIHLIS